jgi:drug/metabolite transporter (DMT)-like permease
MSEYTAGILLGLTTAVCWTGSSMMFAAAGRRVGSVPVNLLRLVAALVFLSAIGQATRGQALPTDATPHQALWLGLSGIVGFFVGDLALFRAYVTIGPRRATLVMSTAPAFAAIVGWAAIGEALSPRQTIGVMMTIAGVAWVIAERAAPPPQPSPMTSPDLPADAHDPHAPRPGAIAHPSPGGVVLALLGAIGQGVGAVMMKRAYEHGRFDAFGSTQLRAVAAVPLFVLFVVLTRRTRDTLAACADGRAMTLLLAGAIIGPVMGVSAFNASGARVPIGVTSTLAALVPIFMLPVAAAVGGERVTRRAAAGAVVAVAGVAVLTLA